MLLWEYNNVKDRHRTWKDVFFTKITQKVFAISAYLLSKGGSEWKLLVADIEHNVIIKCNHSPNCNFLLNGVNIMYISVAL